MTMLWLVAYQFLLRVPSEALPMCRGDPCFNPPPAAQSVVYLDGQGVLCLKLRSRKNKPEGSLLRRSCSCAADPRLCVVHRLWHGFLEHFSLGEMPWADISAAAAITLLRNVLRALGVWRSFLISAVQG